ncbi:hypothetical protein ACF064_35275 [Streptomyces sp. NPDC015492]|uniref:hypothetical protein n=1 Tax=Streptomyces sp. NPDC015492 TaxID=3364958 RepID=UPI0036F71E11
MIILVVMAIVGIGMIFLVREENSGAVGSGHSPHREGISTCQSAVLDPNRCGNPSE